MQPQPASRIARVAFSVAVFLVLSLPAAPALAQDEGEGRDASAEVAFDVGSHYAWRGLRLSKGLVSQASIDAEYKGWGLGIWSNYDPLEYPIDSGSRRRITETDVTAWHGRAWGPGLATAGLVYYAQRGGPDTSELFVAYELDLPLAPSATLYVDLDEGDGAFLVLAASHSLAVAGAATLDIGAEAGWNFRNAVMGTGEDDEPLAGPYHAEFWASGAIPLGRRLAVTPRVGVSFPLTRRAGDAIAWAGYDGETRTFVYGSLGISASF